MSETIKPQVGIGATETTDVLDVVPVDTNFAEQKVILKTLRVKIPDEPFIINGHAYGLDIDDALLAEAVNRANGTRQTESGLYSVNIVEIKYSDSLPSVLVEGEETQPMRYDHTTKSVTCSVPKEVIKSGENTEVLVDLYEKALNEQIELGLIQSITTREALKRRISQRYLALYLGSMVGFFAGTEISEDSDIFTNAVDGAAGAGMGALAVIAAVAAGFLPDGYKNIKKRSIKKANKKFQSDRNTTGTPIFEYNPLAELLKDKPIKLKPIQLPE